MVKNKMKIKWLFICVALCALWILFWKLEISGANELETGDIATGEEMDEPDMPYEPFFFDEERADSERNDFCFGCRGFGRRNCICGNFEKEPFLLDHISI